MTHSSRSVHDGVTDGRNADDRLPYLEVRVICSDRGGPHVGTMVGGKSCLPDTSNALFVGCETKQLDSVVGEGVPVHVRGAT